MTFARVAELIALGPLIDKNSANHQLATVVCRCPVCAPITSACSLAVAISGTTLRQEDTLHLMVVLVASRNPYSRSAVLVVSL